MTSIPQEPIKPPTPSGDENVRDRLVRAYTARSNWLQQPRYDGSGNKLFEALAPMDAAKRAVSDLPTFLDNNPDTHGPWRDYLQGRSDVIPGDYAPQIKSAAQAMQVEAEKSASAYRAENPVMAGVRDTLDTVGSLAEGAIQGGVNTVVGVMNMLPGDVQRPIDVKAKLRAFAQNNVPWGKPTTEGEARAEIDAVGKTANTGVKIAQTVGHTGGDLYQMMGGGALGAPFKAGHKLGDGLGRAMFAASGKVAAGQAAGRVLGTALGIGTSRMVQEGSKQNETTGELEKAGVADRAKSLGIGSVQGAVMGMLGELGSAAFRAILKTPMSKLGVTEKNASKVLYDWAASNKLYKATRETADAYSKRILNAYAESGFPGMPRMMGRQVVGRALQAGIEGPGLSLLDFQFHRDLIDAATNGDGESLNKVIVRLASDMILTAGMHVGLKNIPAMQRRRDIAATGEAPKPQEPVKPVDPKVDPLGQANDVFAADKKKTADLDWMDQAGKTPVGYDKPQGPPDNAAPVPDKAVGAALSPNLSRMGWETKDAGYITGFDPGQKIDPATLEPIAPEQKPPPRIDPTTGAVLGESGGKASSSDPNWDPSQAGNAPLGGDGRTDPRGEIDPSTGVRMPRTETHHLPGTKFSFEVTGDTARLSPELRKALEAPKEMPIKDLAAAIEDASLMSALAAKESFPGTEIDASGKIASTEGEGVQRAIILGEPMQAPLLPGAKWEPVTSFPARGKDPIPLEQKGVVDALTVIINTRTDLAQKDRLMLSQIADTLDAVSLHNDLSIAETMGALGPILPEIAGGDPMSAGKAIRAMAEMMTVKSPEIVMRELASDSSLDEAPRPLPGYITESRGRWFTTSRTKAESFGPDLLYVDVPREVAEATVGRGNENVLPDAWKNRAKPISEAGDLADGYTRLYRGHDAGAIPKDAQSYGGMPVPKEAIEVAKVAAQGAKSFGGVVLDKLTKSHTDKVAAHGIPEVANIGRGAIAKQRDFAARMNSEAGSKIARASRKYAMKDEVWDEYGGGTTVYGANADEGLASHFGPTRALSDREAHLLHLHQKLNYESAKIAQEIGVTFSNRGEDGPQGITPSMERKRLTRIPTPDLVHATRERKGPVWDALRNWVKKKYGYTEQQVLDEFSDVQGVTRKDSTEVLRTLPVLPTMLRTAEGLKVKIFEDTPHEHSERMVQSTSHILSARAVMPREAMKTDKKINPYMDRGEGDPIPDGNAKQLLDWVNTEHGATAAKDVADMVRLMHGMSLSKRAEWMGTPGSSREHLIRLVSSAMGMMKSLALSGSFPLNLAEPLADAPMLTLSSIGKGYKDVMQSFAGGTIREMHAEAVRDGWIADSHDNHQFGGDSTLESIENGIDKVAAVILSPLHLTQAAAELIKFSAAKERLALMREGNGSAADLNALKLLEFTPAEAQRMIRGEGTEAEYARYRTGIVGQLSGGKSLHQLAKSEAALSRGWNSMVWFTGFFQQRMRVARSLADSILNDSGQSKIEATGHLANLAAMTVVSGVAGQVINHLFKGDLYDYLRETIVGEDDEATALKTSKTMLKMLVGGLAGGLGQPAMDAMFRPSSGEDGESKLLKTAGGMLPVVGIAGDALDLVTALRGGDVPGYENLSAGGKMLKFFKDRTPLATTVERGLFGIGALALTEHAPELDAATRSLNRWRFDNKPYPDTERPEHTKAFRDAMKVVVDRVMSGDSWTDDELADAILEARDSWMDAQDALDQPGKRPTLKDAKRAVAASLLGKRRLANLSTFTEAEKASLYAHLGAEHIDTLEGYDKALKYLADKISK